MEDLLRITRLEACTPPRGDCRLYVDEIFELELPASLLAEAGLYAGRTITAAELDELRRRATGHRALEAALHFLSYRPRSRTEIERQLRRKGHGSDASAWALNRCLQLGYIDDLAFATAFVRDRIRLRPQGRRRLTSELRGRGVSEADTRAGIEAAFREERVEEAELLEAVAARRWRALRSAEPAAARRRLTSYLARRGFPPDQVRETVGRLSGGG